MSSKRLQLVLAIALALVLLVPGAAAFAQDGEPTPSSGTVCVDGLVIDWEEEPLAEGWYVDATPAGGTGGDPVQAEPDEDNPGVFKFSEDDLEGFTEWNFTIVFDSEDGIKDNEDTIGLEGNWSGVTPTSLDIEFEEDAMKCARIRFKLRETVPVEAIKLDGNHVPQPGWTMIATPGKDNYFAEEWEGETDANGVVPFNNLTPGTWIFTEEPPEDFEDDYDSYQTVIPVNGAQTLEIEREKPYSETITLYFKNKLINGGCIDVTKTGVAPEGSQGVNFGLVGWEISVLTADGKEVAYGYTDVEGKIKFEGLASGPYTVVEESRSGWTSAADVSSYDVDVKENEDCAAVTFENVQAEDAYCIEGAIVDANGDYGLPGWVVEVTPVDKNGYELENGDTFTTTAPNGMYTVDFVDADGNAVDDYRLSGGAYRICVKDDADRTEDDVNGWLPHTKECFQVKLPAEPSKTCTMAPKFVYQQVGHTESGKEAASSSSSMSWSGGSSMDMGKPMGGMDMGGMDMGKPEMKCSKYHTVQKGEGLYQIGADNMVPAGKMLAANPDVAARSNKYVVPGEKVCIP